VKNEKSDTKIENPNANAI